MSFASDIRKFADKAKIGYDKAVGAALFDLSSSIALMTPVDEGRARGNWFASLSSYPTTTSNNTRPNLNQIKAVADKAAGNVFFITNNLPYIGTLEYGLYNQPGTDKTVGGYSSQAPQGMVRLSIENFDIMLTKAAKTL